MTLEQMLATPSVVAALVVVAVVVFVVAFLLGRRRGFQDVQDGVDPNDPSLFGAAKNTSLFGPRVPVQSTERQLVAVMPEALVVVDSPASRCPKTRSTCTCASDRSPTTYLRFSFPT